MAGAVCCLHRIICSTWFTPTPRQRTRRRHDGCVGRTLFLNDCLSHLPRTSQRQQWGPSSESRHTYARMHSPSMAFNDTTVRGCFEMICECAACASVCFSMKLFSFGRDSVCRAAGLVDSRRLYTVCNVFIQFVYLIWAPTPRLSDKFDIAPRPICHLLSALSKQMGLRAALFRLSTFLTASIEWSELASGTTQNKVIPPTRQLIYRQFFPIYSQVWTHESNDENGPHSRDNSWTC